MTRAEPGPSGSARIYVPACPTRVARALGGAVDAEYIFAAVIGTGMHHFHEHVFARHRGTPADVAWHASDEVAPIVDEPGVADLARRLGADLSEA